MPIAESRFGKNFAKCSDSFKLSDSCIRDQSVSFSYFIFHINSSCKLQNVKKAPSELAGPGLIPRNWLSYLVSLRNVGTIFAALA